MLCIMKDSFRYISVEFLLYLITPIFLLALRHSYIFGLTLCGSVITITSFMLGLNIYINNYPSSQLPWSEPGLYNSSLYEVFSTILRLIFCSKIIFIGFNSFPQTAVLMWRQKRLFDQCSFFLQQTFEIYIKPTPHIGSYLIGVILGYHLVYHTGALQKLKYPKLAAAAGWIGATCLGLFALFGLYPSIQVWFPSQVWFRGFSDSRIFHCHSIR